MHAVIASSGHSSCTGANAGTRISWWNDRCQWLSVGSFIRQTSPRTCRDCDDTAEDDAVYLWPDQAGKKIQVYEMLGSSHAMKNLISRNP